MKKKILVIAPHPDDEVLGVGGTIKKRVNEGHEAHLCIVTVAYTPDWSEDFLKKREEEINKASKTLGFTSVSLLKLPTVKLDTLPQKELNAKIGEVIKKIQPDTVYIPFYGDVNNDHQLVCAASLVVTRPLPGNLVKEVLMYETLSETEYGLTPFVPHIYENIETTLAAKIEAMKCYSSELKEFPHPRSLEAIEALAKKRGSEVGVRAAEAFAVVRIVNF